MTLLDNAGVKKAW